MSWSLVDDELLSLARLVQTMEEEEEEQTTATQAQSDHLEPDTPKGQLPASQAPKGQLPASETPKGQLPARKARPAARFTQLEDLLKKHEAKQEAETAKEVTPEDEKLKPAFSPLPVSRLLEELKHFDKEKSLRKVKIEMSLEDAVGWGGGQEVSLRHRRLSESSLEVTEAARFVKPLKQNMEYSYRSRK